jgi:uncharacterized membrane protein
MGKKDIITGAVVVLLLAAVTVWVVVSIYNHGT